MVELQRCTYGDKLKNLLNDVFHGIVLINENYNIIEVNGPASDMLGDHEKSISGSSVLEYVAEQDQEKLKTYLDQCKNQDHQLTDLKEIEFKYKGSFSLLEIDFNHFFIDPSDDKVYSIGILYDITEKAELEDEVELQIKNKIKIQQKLEKELELSDMKSRFISIASHEFRTPLAGILSSIDLAERYVNIEKEKWDKLKNKDKIEAHFESIKKSVSHLTITLNQFLSLGKLEDGKIEYTPLDFDLKKAIEIQIDQFEHLKKSNQEVYFSFKGERSIGYLDENIFRNVINNLLSNAVKYTPESKNIYISLEINNHEIIITIKDEGYGIPEKEQKNMFRRFFRAKNVENIQGTGLGLNIVKKYMDLMNGTINFDSKENEGTTFYLNIKKTVNNAIDL